MLSPPQVELSDLELKLKEVFGVNVDAYQTETTDLYLLPPGEDQVRLLSTA